MSKDLEQPSPEGEGFWGRLKSTEGPPSPRHAGSRLADSKAVVVLGLGTLELDILRDHFVRDVPAAADEVAARPQVPTPELRPQPPMVLQEMMGRLALDRLHDPARREVRRDAQKQMDMSRPDVTLQDLDVERPADLPNQIPNLRPDLSSQHRLAILRDEHEVVVQRIHRMGGSTIFAHGADRISSPLKASPEGEGVHPSQNATLSGSRAHARADRCRHRLLVPSAVRPVPSGFRVADHSARQTVYGVAGMTPSQACLDGGARRWHRRRHEQVRRTGVPQSWDIRAEGRTWTEEEALARYELTPDKIEMVDGKLLWDDEQRLLLLALLLENVGVNAAVRLGNPNVWRAAVERLE